MVLKVEKTMKLLELCNDVVEVKEPGEVERREKADNVYDEKLVDQRVERSVEMANQSTSMQCNKAIVWEDGNEPMDAETTLAKRVDSREFEDIGEAEVKEADGSQRSPPGAESTETEWRVKIVKRFRWLKCEVDVCTAHSIVDALIAADVMSDGQKETMKSYTGCSRREVVNFILHHILKSKSSYEVFLKYLREIDHHIVRELENTSVSRQEKTAYIALDKRPVHKGKRKRSSTDCLFLLAHDRDVLKKVLNTEDAIDLLNDIFLSKFFFSVHDHNNIQNCSLGKFERVSELIRTMEQCPDEIFEVMFEEPIDVKRDLPGLEKLERKPNGKRRKTDTGSAGRELENLQRHSDSVSETVVTSNALESSSLTAFAMSVDSEFLAIEYGSVVVRLSPTTPASWGKLKEMCRSGSIVNFIESVFEQPNRQILLKGGQYCLRLSIYGSSIKDAGDLESAESECGDMVFRLDIEQSPESEAGFMRSSCPDNYPIQHHMKLLTEELDITPDLLDVLEKERLIDPKVRQMIAEKITRRDKLCYMLQHLNKSGKRGYDVLCKHIEGKKEYTYLSKELRNRTPVYSGSYKMTLSRKGEIQKLESILEVAGKTSSGDCRTFGNSTSDLNELRILLIGKTGKGKSLTANRVLGEKVDKAGLNGIDRIEQPEVRKANRLGKSIVLVDTPGLFDFQPDSASESVRKYTGMVTPVHAFLIVLQVGRFTQEEKEIINHLELRFGDSLYKRSIIVFTDDDLKGNLETFLKTPYPNELEAFLSMCNSRCVYLSNKASEAEADAVVNRMFGMIDQMEKDVDPGAFLALDASEPGQLENTYQRKMTEELEKLHRETLESISELLRNIQEQTKQISSRLKSEVEEMERRRTDVEIRNKTPTEIKLHLPGKSIRDDRRDMVERKGFVNTIIKLARDAVTTGVSLSMQPASNCAKS